jgi:hypothetical protein
MYSSQVGGTYKKAKHIRFIIRIHGKRFAIGIVITIGTDEAEGDKLE